MVPYVVTSITKNLTAPVVISSHFMLQAKLIHLGAKYSPCMRNDENVRKAIEKDMKGEKKSACCVNNDGSGCVQANIGKCPVRYRDLILSGTFEKTSKLSLIRLWRHSE